MRVFLNCNFLLTLGCPQKSFVIPVCHLPIIKIMNYQCHLIQLSPIHFMRCNIILISGAEAYLLARRIISPTCRLHGSGILYFIHALFGTFLNSKLVENKSIYIVPYSYCSWKVLSKIGNVTVLFMTNKKFKFKSWSYIFCTEMFEDWQFS